MTTARSLITAAVVSVALSWLTGAPASATNNPASLTVGADARAVILVPGYNAPLSSPTSTPLGAALQDAGFDVFLANVGNMTGSLATSARALRAQGRILRQSGYDSVDLVGLSAGGLASRAAITIDHDYRGRTFRTAVAIGSPLQGSDMDALGEGWECIHTACRQMKPDSAFMRSLQPLPTGRNTTRFVSLWSQDDLVVNRASSILPGAENIHIQQACPGVQNIWTGHEHLASSPAFIDLTTQALTGKVDPGDSVYQCALPTPLR